MKSTILTELACSAASCPPDKSFARLYDREGLYLHVTATGGKYWRLKFRSGGRERLLALGAYPSVTLKAARMKVAEARMQLVTGIDPTAARRKAKQAEAEKTALRFDHVAGLWYAKASAAWTERHAGYVLRRLQADVYPALGDIPVNLITARQIAQAVESIAAHGAHEMARRAFQYVASVLRFAVTHGLADRNPATDMEPSDILETRKETHYARVTPAEFPELLRKVDTYAGADVTRLAMQLMALTFVRTGELIGARGCEFDLDAAEWRIPPERMKMGTEHRVPLSRQAVAVVRTLVDLSHRRGSDWLCHSPQGGGKAISNNTILYALHGLGYQGRMTGHGFRGVASTILHEMGFPHDVIELQLAHLHGDEVSRAYNAAMRLRERADMMQQWADHIDSIKRGADVLAFRGGRGLRAA